MRAPTDLPAITECPDEYLDGMEGHERARHRLAYALGAREQQLREALRQIDVERGVKS